VAMVRSLESEHDLHMQVGDHVQVAGARFVFEGVQKTEGPNYEALQARVRVQPGGDRDFVLHPEKRVYRMQRMPMTEAAIDAGFTRDIYVSLGEALADGGWTLRIYHKPFINWIWGGALLMAMGGGLAAADRRYWGFRRRYPGAALVSAGAAK
jgi:cytochrome c-type biogenesis protein CcmF